MEPEDIQGWEQWVNLKVLTGDVKEAENGIQKIKSINPDIDMGTYEGFLFALNGEKEKALAQSDSWIIYVVLGMKKEALDRLEKESLVFHYYYLSLKNLNFFDPLRAEPRFIKKLEDAKVRYEENLKRYAN